MVNFRKISEISIWLLCLGPLIVVTGFMFPFTLPRAALMLFFCLVCIVAGTFSFRRITTVSITLVDILYFIFTCIIFFTSLTGVNILNSFWSDAGRGMGTAYLIAVFFVYCCGRFLNWEQGEWRGFWFFTAGTLCVTSIIGFIQLFNSDILSAASGDRVSSTFGNGLIFAGYLMPYLFVCTALIAEKKRYTFPAWFTKFFLPALIVLALFVLVQTKTRSSFLGLGAGLVVLVCGIIFSAKKNDLAGALRRPLIIFSVVGMLLYSGLFVYARQSQNHTLLRLTFATNDSITLKTRLLNWGIAVAAIKDHPILGWGFENYRSATDVHFDPRLSSFSYYETRIDKPHNAWLEWLVTTGIVGFAAYSALIIGTIFVLYRAMQRDVLHPLAAWGFIAALVAHEVQNFFAFDTHTTIWMLMMIFLFASSVSEPIKIITISKIPTYFFRALCIVVSIFAYGIFLFGVWAPLYNGYYVQIALDGLQRHDVAMTDRAFRVTENAIRGPYIFDTWRWMSHALLFNFASKVDKLESIPPNVRPLWDEDVKKIARTTDELSFIHADSPDWLLYTGKIEYYLGITLDDSLYMSKAQVNFEKSFSLAPHRQEPVLLLVYVHALKGESAAAVDALIAARTIAPSTEVNTAVDFLAAHFQHENDHANAARLFEYLTSIEQKADWYARLAAAYASLHRYEDTRRAVERAVQIDPTFATDAQTFLKTLPK